MQESGQIKIVIVEDHEFTRFGLKLSLEQVPGFKVIGEASDGQIAIQEVINTKPDLVLMDIELPILNGIDATREIRKLCPDVQIIMLTSHTSDREIFAALSAGANGYCLKNISSEDLTTVIKGVAEGAVWLDPGIANRVLCTYTAEPALPPSVTPGRRKRSKSSSGDDAPTLSPRETEVLRLVAAGLTNQQIAEHLTLGIETVKTHMRHIMEKLAVSDRTEAAVKAMRHGLVS